MDTEQSEKSYLEKVREFHDRFRHPVMASPHIPSAQRCKLRVNLLKEELEELQKAINENDILGAADAFCDLQYVLSGAVLEFGLGGKFDALFSEVHRSNMSKACATLEEAQDTAKNYFENNGAECYIKKDGDIYFVYRKSDNKTIKSINYSPANLKPLI